MEGMTPHKPFVETMDGAGFVLAEAAVCERLGRMENWVQQMLLLHRGYKLKILGRCCGTDNRYLSGIVEGIQKDEAPDA